MTGNDPAVIARTSCFMQSMALLMYLMALLITVAIERAANYRWRMQRILPLRLDGVGQDIVMTHSLHSLTVACFGFATCFFRVLPDTFLLGGAKCGSTFLHTLLLQHPAFCLNVGRWKEVHYFQGRSYFGTLFDQAFGSLFDKIIYRSFFPLWAIKAMTEFLSGNVAARVVDGTPTLRHPQLAHRISSVNPTAAAIVVLRDPIDRAYSHYRMLVEVGGVESRTFEDAMLDELQREEAGTYTAVDARSKEEQSLHFLVADYSEAATLHYYDKRYLYPGLYDTHVEAFSQAFGKERILVLSFDFLCDKTEECIQKVCVFLGVAELTHAQFAAWDKTPRGISNGKGHQPHKKTAVREALTAKTLSLLNAFFASSNAGIKKKYGIEL